MGNSYERFVNQVQEYNLLLGQQIFQQATGLKIQLSIEINTRIPSMLKMTWNKRDRVQIMVYVEHENTSDVRILNLHSYARLRDKIESIFSIVNSSDIKMSTSDFECCICLDRKPNVILPCGHKFCKQDIGDWSSRDSTCPICRRDIGPEETHRVFHETINIDRMTEQVLSIILGQE